MTYTELFETRWDRKTDEEAPFLENLDTATKRAWITIELLYDRGGFDHWWDEIEDDIKDDIFEELKEAMQ